MSWVGLWEPAGGAYSPAGLGQASRHVVDINGILPVGTLMMQFALMPSQTEQTVLAYAAQSPWNSGLEISVDPEGCFKLTQWIGERRTVETLATGHLGRARMITLSYSWNAPARCGVLSIEIGDTGQHVFKRLHGPLPLSLRDAVRLMADNTAATYSDMTVFAAIADHEVPIGPLPTLAGQTLIATPQGLQPLSQFKAGQLVTLADGSHAQVRWAGSLSLPARGRFAPVTLQAPYFGALRDLGCAPDQRVHLRGSDVDYLFATPTVACNVGHLTEGVRPFTPPPGKVMRYWQLALDRATSLRVGGLDIETLDVGRIMAVPQLREMSVLADVPGELLPSNAGDGVPILRGFETRTLCHLRAA